MSVINTILREWAYRVDDGQPNVNNPEHITHLVNALVKYDLPESFIYGFVSNIMEGDILVEKGNPEDDKYEHLAHTIYVKQGQKDKKGAQKYEKTENGKYKPVSDDDAKEIMNNTSNGDDKEKEADDKDVSNVTNIFNDEEEIKAKKTQEVTKIASDLTTRVQKLKNQTPERVEAVNLALKGINTLLDPNVSDVEKIEALKTFSWKVSSGSGKRKFYLADLYDGKANRSDKILGDPGTTATETIVKAVEELYKRNNIDMPTELSSRQVGDFGKIEATKIDPTILLANDAYKGDTTQKLEASLGRFEPEQRAKIEHSIKVQRDLGHTESVAVELDVFLDNPEEYKQKMGNVTVAIIRDSRNSMVERFGKQLKPDNIKYLDDKINEMDQMYKSGKLDSNYIGDWYADVKDNISSTNPQLAEAYANNLGEMFAIQEEVLNGHYVVIPTAKNAKLGDKVRLMTRDGASDPSVVTVLTDLMGSVKKEAKTTVGAQHTHVGILEGMDYGTPEEKLNIISSAHAAKYMNLDDMGKMNEGTLKSFLNGSKDLKDLTVIKKMVSDMGLEPTLLDSKDGVSQLTKNWIDGMNNEQFRNKFNKMTLVNAGINSPKTKADVNTLTTYLSDNNLSIDDYVSTMVGNTNPTKGKVSANGETIKNALTALMTGNTDGLDNKALQIATSLIAMPQKTKENFGYDVVDASDKPWSMIENYGRESGETIHQSKGSYIMGFLNAYDMNPRRGKSGKAYNVGKRALGQAKRKNQQLQDLIDSKS
jgi:hypothetical protein